MELKIRIKEVEECSRLLTDEENCYLTVMNIPRVIPSFQKEATELLRKRGFETEDGRFGVFRKETIRDATPEEIIAWHCIQSHIVCLTTDAATCRACPKNRGSNQCKMLEDYFESKKILKSKEIILEVV